jgi:hypothetical protein
MKQIFVYGFLYFYSKFSQTEIFFPLHIIGSLNRLL